MRKHTKIYFDYFGYGKEDFVSCEVCGRRAVDTHHIDCRGMGGSKEKDVIENLMAVCRECHIKYGDKKEYMDFLKEKHHEFMEAYGKFY
jgi:ribosome-binding protein aMBF1 (putative translation factor)